MQVFAYHFKLWGSEDETPKPYTKGDNLSGIFLVLASNRDFYLPACGTSSVEGLELYGDTVFAMPTLDGEHTAVVQRVATNREPSVTAAICDLLYPPSS